MKIIQYCQHVLGIGHLFRSLEISRALSAHAVVLITGGAALDLTLPSHVREFRLPPLMMDETFSELHSHESDQVLETIKIRRREQLERIFQKEKPDVFLVELYPFGRKAFRFELDPLLAGLRSGNPPSCLVFCSLRDILVDKTDAEKHEGRAVQTLNRWFDGLLVHADPAVITLETTFSKTDAISIPIVYTGFVCPKTPEASASMRQRLGLKPEEKLVVASAGGGKVGGPLLTAVIAAVQQINSQKPLRLQVFTGPFLESRDFDRLRSAQNEYIQVERFTPDFPAYLAAADLSISMAGYNTCMNILAAGVPALVWPFSQNREQGLRAAALARKGLLGILSDRDLSAQPLAGCIRSALQQNRTAKTDIRLDGAEATRQWIENRFRLNAGQP